MMTHELPMIDDAMPPAAADDAGFGALECDRGRLPLVAMDIESSICDLTARTTIRQTFRNSLQQPVEATYIFPLPDRAAVTQFRMWVADRTVEGQLQERGAAREQYDRAIKQGHRAAIAEEERSGVFTIRVGNLPPNETATIELSLIGPLPVTAGEATFRFPLVVAPRYTPGIPLDGPAVGAGTAADTDQVPDASRVTPPVLLPGFPNPIRLSLRVTLDLPQWADNRWCDRLQSSLHAVVTDQGPPLAVSLQPGERLDRDFVLRFPVATSEASAALKAATATSSDPGLFSLTLFPPDESRNALPHGRRVVFLLDRSGSMGGWKMVAARRAVGRMVDTLLDQDQFAVLAFDHSIERSQSGFVNGTNRDRWRAVEWLGKLDARGGTELGSAINAAAAMFSAIEPDDGCERMLVIVTDGQVSGEDVILKQMSSESPQPKIFTIGIDRAVNTGFLRRLAALGGGHSEFVESEERLDAAMHSIHRLIGHPVLTDVRLSSTSADIVADSMTPARLPDLYPDRPVTIYGQYLSPDSAVRVQVTATKSDGSLWKTEAVAGRVERDLLTAMWGRMRVRDLEDAYASGLSRQPEKLMKQIVATSLQCKVLSRFTAFVAVDNSEVVNTGGRLHPVIQPVEMPSGWQLGRSQSEDLADGIAMRLSSISAYMAPARDEDDELTLMECAESPNSETKAARPAPAKKTRFSSAPPAKASTGRDPDVRKAAEKFFQRILNDAVLMNASEILIDPSPPSFSLQYLIYGTLVKRETLPRRVPLTDLAKYFRALAGVGNRPHDRSQAGTVDQTVQGRRFNCTITITVNRGGDSIRIILSEAGTAELQKSTRGPKRKWFWK